MASSSTLTLVLFSLVGLGALVHGAVHAKKAGLRELLRAVPTVLLAAGAVAVAALKLVVAATWSVLCVAAALLLLAASYFLAPRLTRWARSAYARLATTRAHKRFLLVLIVLLVTLAIAVCATCALEIPFATAAYPIWPEFAVVEAALVWLLAVTAYLAGGRRSWLVKTLVWALALFGLANYYLYQFKRAAILPTDLFALKTAASVASNYSYALHTQALIGLAMALLASALAGLLDWLPVQRLTTVKHRLSWIAAATASLAISASMLLVPDYRELGAGINYFFPPYTYRVHGSLLSFIAGCQDLKIKAPAGYSDEAAETALAREVSTFDQTLGQTASRSAAEAQFSAQKPNVLVIMDETFADLSIYNELNCGYVGPQFVTEGLTDSLAQGKLAVSVFGGNTCNTEFEFLTQNSFAYLGQGKYPYSMFDLSNVESLPKYFSSLGYTSSAIHPNIASNWDRNVAYPALGFHEFYDITAFTGAERFHSGVSDAATFDFAYQLLSSATTPQFVFAVTMQNHSGYNQNNIPQSKLTNYQPGVGSSQDTAELNEYLSCIEESDAAFQALIGKLRELKTPTIVLFFGDHQPSLARTYAEAWFGSEDALTQTQLQYQTVYTLWANYDIAGAQVGRADTYQSPNYLSSQLLYKAGFPLTDYQKAQLVAAQNLPAVNAFGALDTSGTWHELGALSGTELATYNDMALITYLKFARSL